MNSLLALKLEQSQKFLENGTRIPVTKLNVKGNKIARFLTMDKNNYNAIQLEFGGEITPFKFLREVRIDGQLPEVLPKVGETLDPQTLFKPGDIVNITGISKGKGYAGVVKRHHFKGGPRTHGQSDRERAPGAIGSTTTPGRVYKGKRMAGRMGHEKVTIKNLQIVLVNEDFVWVKGLIAGGRNSLVMIKKVGEDKKFVPLLNVSDKLSDSKETHSREAGSDSARKKEAKDAK